MAGEELSHLVDILDRLLARPILLVYLVLLEQDLQADVLHRLRVEALDLRDQVLLPLLYFMQKLNLILLQLKLGFAEHLTDRSHVMFLG